MFSTKSLVFSLCVPTLLMGDTLYVNDDATGLNDGSNWANAFIDLQNALAVARAGDEVWVAEGTYRPSRDSRREDSFLLPSGVKCYGGFMGTEEGRQDRRLRGRKSVLSGEIGDDSVREDNTYRIVQIINAAADSQLDGFIIKDAYNDRQDNTGRGGGIYTELAYATIANCVFKRNYAGGGGAIWNQSGSPIIENCRFIRNERRAVSNNNSYVEFWSCLFRANKHRGTDGSAIGSFSGSTTLAIGCTFLRNIGRDGGAYFGRDVAQFDNCVFIGNQSDEHGGAIYQFTGPLTIVGCSFFDNYSGFGGGGAVVSVDSALLTNDVFWRNTAAHRHGEDAQLEFGDDSSVISHCLVEGWTGRWGGEGNFDADPKWVDPAGGNLRLSADSPCIDAGDDGAVTQQTDLDGNPRVLGGRVDIGAYENVCGQVIDLAARVVEDDREGHVGDGDGVCESGEDCDVLAEVAVDPAAMPAGATVRVAFRPVDEHGDPDPDPCCATHDCGPGARCPVVRKARINAGGRGVATLRAWPAGRVRVCVEGCAEGLCRDAER